MRVLGVHPGQVVVVVGLVGPAGLLGPLQLDLEPLHADLEAVHGLDGRLRRRRVVEAHEA